MADVLLWYELRPACERRKTFASLACMLQVQPPKASLHQQHQKALTTALFMRRDVITSRAVCAPFYVAQQERSVIIGLIPVELHCWELLECIIAKPPAAVAVQQRLMQGQHHSAAVPYVLQD